MDPIQACASEIVSHVMWKAPEQMINCVAESLWEMTQALKLDPVPLREAMQQITREVHADPTDYSEAAVVERRLRRALGMNGSTTDPIRETADRLVREWLARDGSPDKVTRAGADVLSIRIEKAIRARGGLYRGAVSTLWELAKLADPARHGEPTMMRLCTVNEDYQGAVDAIVPALRRGAAVARPDLVRALCERALSGDYGLSHSLRCTGTDEEGCSCGLSNILLPVARAGGIDAVLGLAPPARPEAKA